MRAANTKAKMYYQLAFVEEDMAAEEKGKQDDVLEVQDKTTGETAASERVKSGKDEGRRRNLVDILMKQENVTDI